MPAKTSTDATMPKAIVFSTEFADLNITIKPEKTKSGAENIYHYQL